MLIMSSRTALSTPRTSSKDLCRHNLAATYAIERAQQQTDRPGRRTDLVDNVNKVERPTGNSQSYAFRKLRKDRPDLLEQVLNGELKTNAAMEQAGFRKLIRSVRMDDPDSAARTIRKFMTEEARRHLAAKLLE